MSQRTSLSALERLRLFLRPPGKGIYTPSTGGGFASTLLKRLYGTDSLKEVTERWEEGLQKLRRSEAVILGVPSDVGAGILRGANLGPIGVREAYLSLYGLYPKNVVDIGDVMVIPQLLHDSMYSTSQIHASREALYPGLKEPLPVSVLSITEEVFSALRELNSEIKIFVIGGDHSISWPSMLHCQAKKGSNFGVLHFDAHTDLLEERLGIKYCFGTWASHAVRLMKPDHLVQVGIRTSAKTKEYWLEKYPIQQFWASEILGKESASIEKIVAHFKSKNIQDIYISNDIDATDSKEAPATGTPESNGLHAPFVKELIQRIKKEFTLLGGDVVEVAPPLSGLSEFSLEPTCRLAADYLRTFISH